MNYTLLVSINSVGRDFCSKLSKPSTAKREREGPTKWEGEGAKDFTLKRPRPKPHEPSAGSADRLLPATRQKAQGASI